MVLNSFDLRPLYLQVVDVFVGKIVSRQWAPGQFLPSEADISREFSLSIGTVRRAFDVLDGFGVIDRSAGRWTMLHDVRSERFLSRLSAVRSADGKRVDGVMDVQHVGLGKADAEIAGDLRIPMHAVVLVSHRRRRHDGRVFATEVAQSPLSPDAAIADEAALREVAARRWFGHGLAVRAVERLSVEAAKSSDRAIGVAAGEPILLLRQVIFGHDGRPLERRVARCYLGQDLVYEV